MKKTENWLLGMLFMLAMIVVLEWIDIRILRATIAVEEQLVNNYKEECGDRTDAPKPTHLEIRHAGKLTCACRGEVCACR